MANKLLQLPGNRLFNNSNIASPGGTATLYLSKTSTLANFLDASAVPLGPTITANGLGQLPDAYGDETVAYRVILRDSSGVQLDGGDIDPFYFGRDNSLITTTAGSSVSTRTLLAAIANPAANQSAILTESGREGTFVFSTANLSAKVTADPQQGIYIAPSSDITGASGAWVRKFSGPLDIRWFGAVADCTGYGVGTNNSPAIQAAITYLRGTGSALYVPDGKFRCSSQLVVKSAIDFLGTTTLQDSTSVSHPDADRGSTLVFDTGVAGVRFSYTVDGDVAGTAVNPGAGGSVMDGIRLLSASAGAASAGKYGLDIRAKVSVRNCEVRGFGDQGVLIQASLSGSDGVVYGNANNSLLLNVRSIGNAGDGFKVSGNDANVVNVIDCHAQSNTGWGFTDDTLIQAQWIGCTHEGNTAGGFRTLRSGVVSSFLGCETEGGSHSIASTCIVKGGNLEQAVANQEQNYGGLAIRNGKILQINNIGDSAPISLSNDGTNVLVGGPIKVQGNIQCRNGTLGYGLGNGGSVTQLTSKSTGVTINTATGAITMNGAALAAGAKVSFTVLCSSILVDDTVLVNVRSSATANSHRAQVTRVANGLFDITVENVTAGPLSETPVINYAILKGASA